MATQISVNQTKMLSFHEAKENEQKSKTSSPYLVFDLMKTLGMELDNKIFVQSVQPKTQACHLGVSSGWRVKRLGNKKIQTLRELRAHKKQCIAASKALGLSSSRCEIYFEKPILKENEKSCYSSLKNAPQNKVRRDHNEYLLRNNRREPEERSQMTKSEYYLDPYKVVNDSSDNINENKTHIAWSPSSLHASLSDHSVTARRLSNKEHSVYEEIRFHEQEKTKDILNSSSIVSPMPFVLEPNLCSLGSTVEKVEGVESWQRSRAPIRRPLSYKSEPLVEILISKGIWKQGILEENHEAYRKYILIDDETSTLSTSTSTLPSIEIRCEEIHYRVRKYGNETKRARVFCFLCGHQVGLSSLQMHFQKCILKWDKRVAIPIQYSLELFDPRSLQKSDNNSRCYKENLDAYNKRAQYIFEEYVKPKCPGCSQGFFLDSLISHVKECCSTQPRVIAEMISKFGGDLYRPIAEDILIQREKAASREQHLTNMNLLQQLRMRHTEQKQKNQNQNQDQDDQRSTPFYNQATMSSASLTRGTRGALLSS